MPAAEDQKRLANRIAQRKFRRQRKDYIAQLERELAICKDGAEAELLQRRKDVEKLRSEQAELRSLLDHVVKNLQRICGEDNDHGNVSDAPELAERNHARDSTGSPAAPWLDRKSKRRDSPSPSPGAETSPVKVRSQLLMRHWSSTTTKETYSFQTATALLLATETGRILWI
jgi:hypothetical protein